MRHDPIRLLTLAPRVVVAFIFLNALAVLAAAPGPVDPPQMTSVVLISVDTLRADHLSCYGYRGVRTRNIDSLAYGGALFEAVNSQVPLTLPSHASLFLSSYPFSNGIEDNGRALDKGAVTLATILKSKGYRTAAFIGGFALDRRFGLDQGFEVYDSPFDVASLRSIRAEDLKRPAGAVLESAEPWLKRNSSAPFFVFVHFYDLHTPYSIPKVKGVAAYANDYDGALAYVDDSLGGLWAFLRREGLFEKTLIVFISDHGEGLGDHGETTHGFFIYQSTLHVPLIIHWPAPAPAHPARMAEPAGLINLAPTILEFLGIQKPPQFQGMSLLSALDHKSDSFLHEIFSESQYAESHFQCSALMSLRVGQYKYIEAPKPELYDLIHDPGEMNNLYGSHKALAEELRERLLALHSRFSSSNKSRHDVLDPEVVERLKSLGYASFSSSQAPLHPGPDPKDRLSDYNTYRRAATLATSGQFRQSDVLLEGLLTKDSTLNWVRNLLGENQQAEGEYREAAQSFQAILGDDPLNLLAHFNLGACYFKLGQLDDAAKEFNATLIVVSGNEAADAQVAVPAEELLGQIWIKKGDYQRAEAQFMHLLTIEPRNYTTLFNLGWLASADHRPADAVKYIEAARDVEPNSPEVHNALGSLYLRQGNLARAESEFLDAVKLAPKYAEAEYNLGLVYERENKKSEAARAFSRSVALDPGSISAKEALQRVSHKE